jgi:acyl-CoA synthetase (AMP-forming)/AMP-acid ligase II
MLIDDVFQTNPNHDRMLNVLPMYHSAGTIMASIAAVFMGIPCVYMRKYKTEGVLKTIEKENITLMVHVPTVYLLMVNHPEFDRYNLSTFRAGIVGGAPKPTDLIEKFRKKLPGVQLLDTFGMTETHTMDFILTDEELEQHTNSVGRVVPIEEIRINDSEGKECPPNVPGEILIKGSKTMGGYWKNPEETSKAIVNDWYHTGDVGKIDDKGYVFILGRVKDMINRGGENIYSVEVERVLCEHQKVSEAVVIGVPDEVFGEEVKAYIILNDREKATGEEIKNYCEPFLADYKIPKFIELVYDLPRNPMGKVMKKVLREKNGGTLKKLTGC